MVSKEFVIALVIVIVLAFSHLGVYHLGDKKGFRRGFQLEVEKTEELLEKGIVSKDIRQLRLGHNIYRVPMGAPHLFGPDADLSELNGKSGVVITEPDLESARQLYCKAIYPALTGQTVCYFNEYYKYFQFEDKPICEDIWDELYDQTVLNTL